MSCERGPINIFGNQINLVVQILMMLGIAFDQRRDSGVIRRCVSTCFSKKSSTSLGIPLSAQYFQECSSSSFVVRDELSSPLSATLEFAQYGPILGPPF